MWAYQNLKINNNPSRFFLAEDVGFCSAVDILRNVFWYLKEKRHKHKDVFKSVWEIERIVIDDWNHQKYK